MTITRPITSGLSHSA